MHDDSFICMHCCFVRLDLSQQTHILNANRTNTNIHIPINISIRAFCRCLITLKPRFAKAKGGHCVELGRVMSVRWEYNFVVNEISENMPR